MKKFIKSFNVQKIIYTLCVIIVFWLYALDIFTGQFQQTDRFTLVRNLLYLVALPLGTYFAFIYMRIQGRKTYNALTFVAYGVLYILQLFFLTSDIVIDYYWEDFVFALLVICRLLIGVWATVHIFLPMLKTEKKPHQFFCDNERKIIIDVTFVYGEGNEPSNEEIGKHLSKGMQSYFEEKEEEKK